MSDTLGKLSYGQKEGNRFLGRDLMEHKDYSEATSESIDAEVHKLVKLAYERAKKLLLENQDKLDLIANRLMEKEVMSLEETKILIGMTNHETTHPSVPKEEDLPTSENK